MKKTTIVAAMFAALMTAGASAAVNSQLSTLNSQLSTVVAEDEYTVIEADALPQAVRDALAGDAYQGLTLKEAAVKEADGVKTYRVTLVGEDEQATVVFFNENGEVVNPA